MGFEIVAQTHQADLNVVFDQADKIYVEGNILHAYCSDDLSSVEKIYDHILDIASQQNIESLQIPLMPSKLTEEHIYPIAFRAIDRFLKEHELNIYLNMEGFAIDQFKEQIEKDLFQDIQSLLDETAIFAPRPCRSRRLPDFVKNGVNPAREASSLANGHRRLSSIYGDFYLENELNEVMKKSKSVSFGERLIQLIDEKGYPKDSLVYNKAMIDRRLYHNIISKSDYLPKKNTVILLALALELNEEEAKDFLSYAGYSFSNSRKDQIILYCIRNNYFKVMYINGYLYDKGLSPLLTIE